MGFIKTRRGIGAAGGRLFASRFGFGKGAAIDLDFTKMAALNPRVSFSRASSASMWNASGILVTAGSNIPRLDSTLVTNLLYPSNAWNTAQPASGSLDGYVYDGAVAPDGTTVKTFRVVPGTFSTGNHYTYRGFTASPSTTYTLSLYVKAQGYYGIRLALENSSFPTARYAGFDLLTGAVVYQTDATTNARIQPAGNGWWRIALTNVTSATIANTIATFWVAPTGAMAAVTATFTGDGVSGIDVWGEQAEIGKEANALAPSGVSAPASAWQPAGLLLEHQATNLLQQSASQTALPWNTAFNGTAIAWTPNFAVAPDGTTTATKIVQPACSSGYSFTYQGLTLAAGPYVGSIWLRGAVGGETLYLMLENVNVAGYYRTPITLTTTWQRYVVAGSVGASGTWYFQIGADLRDSSQSAIAGGTIYAWGAQLESGYSATSYIATTTAAATRAADVAYVAGAAFPWLNGNSGSMAIQFKYNGPNPAGGNFTRYAVFNDGASPDVGTEWGFSNSLGSNGAVNLGVSVGKAGVQASARSTATFSPGDVVSGTMAWNATTLSMSMNLDGLRAAAVDLAANVPRTTSKLLLNGRARYQDEASLWLRRVTTYPSRRDDAWVVQRASGAAT